ncbi:MAG: PAS domain-containing protein, partial [Planctomycetota bacterium]
MASKRRKEPTIVLVVFLIILVGLIAAFILRGNFRALEEHYSWKQLSIVGGILFFIYILYVELRGKRLSRTIVEEKIKTHVLVEALPQPVVVLDDHGTVVTANGPACRMLSADAVASVGRPAETLFNDATTANIRKSTGGKFDGRSADGRTEFRVTVGALSGGAGRLVVLEEPGGTVVGRAAAPPAAQPVLPPLWDRICDLSEQLDSFTDEARRTVAWTLLRARKNYNRVEEIEGVPAKAAGAELNLAELVREAAAKVAAAAKAKKVAVEVAPAGECTAKVNRDLMLRALEEILVNALIYSPEGGAVKIEVETGGKDVSVRVTDG